VPVVSLVGEYFVRKDDFSRMNILDYLQERGFVVRVAPAIEYLCYSNRNVRSGLQEGAMSPRQKALMHLRAGMMQWWERRIKTILASSGLYRFEMVDIDETVEGVGHLVDENLRGECILTVGSSMREILHDSCGVIAIGPFGCMPSRIAEAILKKEMNVEGKRRMRGWERKARAFEDIGSFPFLSIETDGNPFPQVIEANLEAFVLQARRTNRRMASLGERPAVTNLVRTLRVLGVSVPFQALLAFFRAE
jgi:hypothetical protein